MADVTVTFGAEDTGLQRTLNMIQGELTQLRASATSGELSVEELKQTLRQIAQLEGVDTRIRQIASGTNQLGNESNQASAQVNRLQAELRETGAVATTAATGGFTSFRDGLNNIGTQIAILYGTIQGVRGMFNFMVGAIQNAVDLNEAINRSNVIFGDASQAIQSWASTAATAFGQSSSQAISAATQFALFGRQAGLSGNDLINFSQTLTALAADMASFANTTPQDAITALGAALRGESEPIRRYGVLLDDATLRNRAMADGIRDTTTGALTPGQRVLAAYSEILQQTSTQQGDFARTNGELANQTRILQAEVTNLSSELGQVLTPAAQTFVGIARDLLPVVQDLVDEYQQFAQATNEAGLGLNDTNAAAGPATGMLDLLRVTVSSVVGPITDLVTGTSNYRDAAEASAQAARDAANGIHQVGNTSTLTAAELAALETSTQQTATSMSTAFQGVGGIFSDINANIASGNTSLEQFNLTASGASAPLQGNLTLFGQQVAEIGNINTVLGTTEGMLGNQNLTLGTINNGYEMWRAVTTDINAVEERKAEILQAQNDRVAATLANLQRTLQAGLDFQGVNFGNISGMATNAFNARQNMEGIRTVGDEMRAMATPPAVVDMATKTREARQLINDFGRYIGQDLSQMSFPDVARRLGVDAIGPRGEFQIDAIVDHINTRLNQPVDLPINTSFDPSLVRAPLESPINLTINGNFDPLQIRRPLEQPINMNLSGGDFVNHTRNLLSQPIDMVFTDGLGFAPMIRQDLSQPINMNLLSGGFEQQTRQRLQDPVLMDLQSSFDQHMRARLGDPVNMSLNSGGFENQLRISLESPITMSLNSGGFENQVRNDLSTTAVTMSLNSGGFEQQVQSNLQSPTALSLSDGGFVSQTFANLSGTATPTLNASSSISQISNQLNGTYSPQLDFADFNSQWSAVSTTINSQATGGPGGEGGGGGQGGPGGDGGDFDPSGLTGVITAINQVRDRLPITVLAP